MNTALQNIKSFLSKLECKQLSIEVDQWKLQKRISCLKESLENVRELKNKLELLAGCTMEEKDVRSINNKIKKLKSKHKKSKLSKSDSYSRSVKSNKRKCTQSSAGKKFSIFKVEKLKERALDDESASSGSRKRKNRGTLHKKSKLTDCYSMSITDQSRKSTSTLKSAHSDDSQIFHGVDEEILQRYLNDTAKYRNTNVYDKDEESMGNDSLFVKKSLKNESKRNKGNSKCSSCGGGGAEAKLQIPVPTEFPFSKSKEFVNPKMNNAKKRSQIFSLLFKNRQKKNRSQLNRLNVGKLNQGLERSKFFR